MEKVLSAVVAGALVCVLAFAVISVTNGVKKGSSNIVDLNETTIEEAKNITVETIPDEKNTKAAKLEEPVTKSDIPTKAPDNASQNEDTDAVGGEIEVGADDTGDNISAKYSFGENDTLLRPVSGDIIMKYSMDSTIYYKTLGLYKVNPAVNIAAAVGTEVAAAASGVVSSIDVSDETGTTVSIAIGNNYVTTYGMLDNVSLKKGMTVVAGDIIGTVAEPTRYYSQEGANLYFKLTSDGAPIDPTQYFE